MPTVRVTVPHQDLSTAQRQRLVGRLTEEVGQFFESEGKGDLRRFVVVHLLETGEGGYGVGGEIIG